MSGRRALITGGASGIGRAIAQRFAQAQLQVVVADIDAAGAQRAAGELGVHAELADVGDPAAARALVARVNARLGGVDVLVNNAGLPSSYAEGDDWERWRLGIDQTLSSVYLMTTLVIPSMPTDGRGCVINIASKAAFLALDAVWYGAAKAGVVSLTRSLARQLGPRQIRVNAICPDVIETPRTRAMLADEARRRATLARIPLGRVGQPRDVAEAAFFLASEETAGFITGSALMLDGGASP